MARDGRRPRRDVSSHYARLGQGVQNDSESSESRATNGGNASGVQNYQSLSSSARQQVYRGRNPKRRKSRNIFPFVLVSLIVVGMVGGAIFWWNNRLVQVRVNGDETRVRIGASIEEVRRSCNIEPTPGNYVTVKGNLITEGAGWPYSAEVEGKNLHGKAFDNYRVRGGEYITIGDGADKTEPYDVEIVKVQPKLKFKGETGAISYISRWGRVGKREIRTGRESGEVDKSHWKLRVKHCYVKTLNPKPTDGRKLVALTFDDGPSEYTQSYLDILAEKNVKATFFCLGESVELFPAEAQAIIAYGHQLANHSYSHQQLTALGGDDLRSELSKGFSVIADTTGVKTTVIRPPYGDFSQSCWFESQGLISVSVLWNQDSLDWEMPGVDAIVQNSLSHMESGSIILMHDGGGDRSQDLEALPQIIDRWREEGFEFVTINELLAASDIPEKIATGKATLPKNRVWPTKMAS